MFNLFLLLRYNESIIIESFNVSLFDNHFLTEVIKLKKIVQSKKVNRLELSNYCTKNGIHPKSYSHLKWYSSLSRVDRIFCLYFKIIIYSTSSSIIDKLKLFLFKPILLFLIYFW